MIIHHKDNLNNFQIYLTKSLKYSNSFTFIPIKISQKQTNKLDQFILQTPLLFSPFGI